MLTIFKSHFSRVALLGAALGPAGSADALFLDGSGHYSLIGETQTVPGMNQGNGMHQAVRQSFRLLGEARLNDRSSFFLELRLFENPRNAWLGDTSNPGECDGEGSCEGRSQDPERPKYSSYIPRVTKAYAQYAFDFCILEAGRRGRSWGMGMFLDEGNDPFDIDASIYDGVTCKINNTKSQTLGFSIGYDKLAETGNWAHDPYGTGLTDDENQRRRSAEFGASNRSDDLDQVFFSIEYDDRRTQAGSGLTKHVGLYFANIFSVSQNNGDNPGGTSTDLKYLDLYTAFYLQNLSIKNEILFRVGKSGSPSWYHYGGQRDVDADEGNEINNRAVNNVQSIALATQIDWTLSRSGTVIGPERYGKGDASRHLMFLDFAYAPGDSDGYITPEMEAQGIERDKKTKTFAMHGNFKPALIMFNGHPSLDNTAVSGVYHPAKVMNASLFGLGYKYESLVYGNYEAKLITGRLISGIDGESEAFYDASSDSDRPIGFYGQDLGWELDLKYTTNVRGEVELGASLAAILPGKAFQTSEDTSASNNFLVQSFVAFHF